MLDHLAHISKWPDLYILINSDLCLYLRAKQTDAPVPSENKARFFRSCSCSSRTRRKNSRNHFVRNKSRRLSFSVNLGRSDLISFSTEDMNAAPESKHESRPRNENPVRTVKTRFDESCSEPRKRTECV